MSVIPKLIWVILNLLCIGLDIAIFFMIVRIIILWQSIPLLEKFNYIGKDLIDIIVKNICMLWDKAKRKSLSEKGRLFFSLTTLVFVRFILNEFSSLLL